MHDIVWVALGGGAGSAFRYLVTRAVDSRVVAGGGMWPVGTFTVNIVGSFVVGVIAGMVATRISGQLRIGLVVGFLGGFTTFSTFAFETLALLRSGDTRLAISNVLASVVLGVFAALIGFVIGESMTS